MSGYLIILCCVISLIVGGSGTYMAKGNADKVHLEQAIEDQKNADTTSCNAAKKITEDADVKIQHDNANLNAHLNAALRVPAACVPIASSATGRASEKGQPGQAQAHAGLNSTWLIQYAGQCEQDRLRLNDLIDFVDAVWSLE